MELRDTVGTWFSELVDNWEECDFHWFTWDDRRKKDRYRRFGDLPDGRHFGAGFVPAFGDPWGRESAILIVGETGELQHDTPSRIKERGWPTAMAVSPSGRSLAWLTDDNVLGVWTQRSDGFVIWDGTILNGRFGDRPIVDVRMNADDILELRLEGEETAGYLCGADVVLSPWRDGWIPRADECGNLSYALKNGYLETCPESICVLICEEDNWGEYAGRGVKQVVFAPGLERIEGEILADNPDLETVVIPASVQQVDWRAFGGCTNLKSLVIEGDLSRVANWDKDAFEGCPCEEDYARMRREAIETVLEQCTDDAVLYGMACYAGKDPDLVSV